MTFQSIIFFPVGHSTRQLRLALSYSERFVVWVKSRIRPEDCSFKTITTYQVLLAKTPKIYKFANIMAWSLKFNKCPTVLLMPDCLNVRTYCFARKAQGRNKSQHHGLFLLPGWITVIINWYSNYKTLRVQILKIRNNHIFNNKSAI